MVMWLCIGGARTPNEADVGPAEEASQKWCARAWQQIGRESFPEQTREGGLIATRQGLVGERQGSRGASHKGRNMADSEAIWQGWHVEQVLGLPRVVTYVVVWWWMGKRTPKSAGREMASAEDHSDTTLVNFLLQTNLSGREHRIPNAHWWHWLATHLLLSHAKQLKINLNKNIVCFYATLLAPRMDLQNLYKHFSNKQLAVLMSSKRARVF